MNDDPMPAEQRAVAAQRMRDHVGDLERLAKSTRLPDTALVVQFQQDGAYVAAHIIPTSLHQRPERARLRHDHFVALPAGQSVTRETLLDAIAVWEEHGRDIFSPTQP